MYMNISLLVCIINVIELVVLNVIELAVLNVIELVELNVHVFEHVRAAGYSILREIDSLIDFTAHC